MYAADTRWTMIKHSVSGVNTSNSAREGSWYCERFSTFAICFVWSSIGMMLLELWPSVSSGGNENASLRRSSSESLDAEISDICCSIMSISICTLSF